jgi:hypothetical protein
MTWINGDVAAALFGSSPASATARLDQPERMR